MSYLHRPNPIKLLLLNFSTLFCDKKGKTVPSYSQVIEEELRQWKKFGDTLRGKDWGIFGRLRNKQGSTPPRNDCGCADPFKPMVLSVLLEQRKEIEKLKERIEESE